MSYDLFTRTTTRNHYAVIQEIFSTLLRNGYIFPKATLGAISPSTGRTLPDRYIEGTCPICGYPSARGDQCDNCGNQLDPTDLINPRSRINGETPLFVEQEHYFLDLPAFTDVLGAWLQSKSGQWRPNVLKFSLNLLDDLQPRAITRDLDWGVPGAARRLAGPATTRGSTSGSTRSSATCRRPSSGPAGPATRTPGAPGGTTRAPRPTTSWARTTSSSTRRSGRRCCSATTGKGPRAATPGPFGQLDLPTEVVSSEFLTMEGRKFSSSRQVVIYVRDFLDRYDVDALRYYVAVAGPETQDTDFTWSEFVRRNNDELVATWGNLVNRAVSFAAQEHRLDPGRGRADRRRPRAARDDQAARSPRSASTCRTRGSSSRSTRRCARSAEANKYFSEQAPWKLRESDPERMRTDPARHAAGHGRREDAAHPVPAALVAGRARDARRHRRLVRHAADRDGGRGGRPVLPGDHRRPTTRRSAGSRGRSRRARRWPSPSRCSPSWTSQWLTRKSPGSPVNE